MNMNTMTTDEIQQRLTSIVLREVDGVVGRHERDVVFFLLHAFLDESLLGFFRGLNILDLSPETPQNNTINIEPN
jgi:hypothetical protein